MNKETRESLASQLIVLRYEKQRIIAQERALTDQLKAHMRDSKIHVIHFAGPEGNKYLRFVRKNQISISAEDLAKATTEIDAFEHSRVLIGEVRREFGDDLVKKISTPVGINELICVYPR